VAVRTESFSGKIMVELVLASASPRRSQLLRQLNLSFRTITPDIDETPLADEPAGDYVQRMSDGKVSAAFGLLSPADRVNPIVVLDGDILGKPVNESAGIEMLLRLSNRTHQVLTSVTLACPASTQRESFSVETQVTFGVVTRRDAERYWLSGEPQDKSGGYGIQGLGAIFVTSSGSNVAGLPLQETAFWLARFGIDCLPPHVSAAHVSEPQEVIQHG
jgi:septum formation protein